MMAKQPWLSILAGSVESGPEELGWADSLTSPCATCRTAPCCTYLPLHRFRVDTMLQLDHARYLVNFDRIELGLSAAGDWSAYYRYPCRFLDRATYGCTLHNTRAQPNICKNYNPYQCWYRKALRSPVSEGFLRIDRPRMQYLVEHTVLDENRAIVAVPSWDTLAAAFATMPCDEQRADDDEIGADPVFDAWRPQVIDLAARPRGEPRRHGFDDLQEPCDGCSAWCCSTLIFPHGIPASHANLDYLRFALGFPGIEIGVHDRGWSIIVKTRCRHLTAGNRCGVYDQPERPLLCRYYDAHQCSYKPQFGETRPTGFVRIRLEQFGALASAFAFDSHGNAIDVPSAERVRAAVEQSWKREAPAAAPL
jgi:hypothetical protein